MCKNRRDFSECAAVRVLRIDYWESVHHSHLLPEQRLYQEVYDEDGNDDRGGLSWKTVAFDFVRCSDHWGGLVLGSELDDGCCFTRHSWSSVERDSKSFGPKRLLKQKLQVALTTTYHRIRGEGNR